MKKLKINEKIKNFLMIFLPILIYLIAGIITSGTTLDGLHRRLIILIWLLIWYRDIWKENQKLHLTFSQICIYLMIFIAKGYITEYALLPIAQRFSSMTYEEFNNLWENTQNLWYSAIIVGPIIEEWLFRGITQRAMEKCFKNVYISIFLQALLFGAWHGNWYQFLGATLGGLFYGYLYHKHKNLKLCIAFHSLNNFMAFY